MFQVRPPLPCWQALHAAIPLSRRFAPPPNHAPWHMSKKVNGEATVHVQCQLGMSQGGRSYSPEGCQLFLFLLLGLVYKWVQMGEPSCGSRRFVDERNSVKLVGSFRSLVRRTFSRYLEKVRRTSLMNLFKKSRQGSLTNILTNFHEKS